MPIPVKHDQLHHERDNTREYRENDHRVHHAVCAHTRFWDKEYPRTGTCLDCGATIALGKWHVVDGETHLSDMELSSERTRYNLFWRGFEIITYGRHQPPTAT